MSLLMESRKNRSSSTTATKIGFGILFSNASIKLAIHATLLAVTSAGEFDNPNLRPRVPLSNANAPINFGLGPDVNSVAAHQGCSRITATQQLVRVSLGLSPPSPMVRKSAI